jgi:hypothetical protein
MVIQIEGSSYRLRQHADLMPEHLRSKALINSPFQPLRDAADGRQNYERSISRPADRQSLRQRALSALRRVHPRA